MRPLKEEEGESCMSIVRDRLQIEPPESSLAFKSGQKNPVSLHHRESVTVVKCHVNVKIARSK